MLKEGDTEFNSASDLFPELGNNEYYKTVGYKEIAMIYGNTVKSFKKTTDAFNRIRQQENGGTSPRTLRENTLNEGNAVLDHMTEISDLTFCEAGFSEDGTWQGKEYASIDPITLSTETVVEAAKKHKDNISIEEVFENPVCYEDSAECVNSSLDDVVVKKQKETRESTVEDETSGRKYVHNTIAHVHNGSKSYTLNGNGTFQVLFFVTALIIRSGLIGKRFLFFTDGHLFLNKSILKQFRWYGNMGIILDWFHLVKKFKELLSLAMKGRVFRNEILRQIMPLLWYGKTEEAIKFLKNIDSMTIKNPDIIERLVKYLNRNKPYIPVYAIRKDLGLRNSSNIGEKMNDLVVSDRQKNNGMSWSKQGSVALATVTALKRNDESRRWFEKNELSFVLKAA